VRGFARRVGTKSLIADAADEETPINVTRDGGKAMTQFDVSAGFRGVALALALLLGSGAMASAQTLTIGQRSGPDSIDPHFSSLGSTVSSVRNIYDTLVSRDHESTPTPSLALTWKSVDENTWEFKLRPDVKFHDGTAFTAEDAKFSIERVKPAAGPTGGMNIYMTGIKEAVVVDPLTLRIITDGPVPLLPRNLAQIFIIPKHVGIAAKPEEFVPGKFAIGTGPYKLAAWQPKGDLVLERFDGYWGTKPAWQRIVFKEMLNDSSRVAALLSGDVDLITNVPPGDVKQISAKTELGVFKTRSVYNFHVYPDMARDVSPMVTDLAGKPLDRNPLKDIRVRQAISKSINRAAIVDRVLEGFGAPAGQLSPEGIWGTSRNLPPEAYDPDGAKKLLADAGYSQGFGITLHCTSDRLPNDAKVCAALGGMFNRIGIKATVAATPRTVYFPAWTRREYSLTMSGWGSLSGESSYILQSLTHTREAGRGGSNNMHYSNPRIDAVIQEATRTLDDEKRELLLVQAMEMAIKDYSTIPVVTLDVLWAGRKDRVVYTARNDEETNVLQMRRP
jgi:peptide/nickel transport system substrate-binding protein